MKLPPLLIALDAIGALFVGRGFAERFAATNPVPSNLQFLNYEIAMIVAGVALMVPMLKHIITHTANHAQKGST